MARAIDAFEDAAGVLNWSGASVTQSLVYSTLDRKTTNRVKARVKRTQKAKAKP